eukprot:316106_1
MSVTVINNVAYIKCGRKPSNKQLGQALMRRTLIIRCIIVPLIDGPHLSIVNGNWYFKCTFWNDANITEDRSIEFLLSKNVCSLHDIILQHSCNWSQAFQDWFRDQSTLLPVTYDVGDIIFDFMDRIYIKLIYIAPNQYRLCYTNQNENIYYKNHSCLYGGHPVNIQESQQTETVTVSRKILYVSNQSELVSHHADSDTTKIIKLQAHQSFINTINSLYFHTKQVKSYHLKINGYGKERKLKPKYFPKMTFVPNIRMLLQSKNYTYKENTKEISFKLNSSQGNDLFYNDDWTPFTRYYPEDKVWCYYIQFNFSKKTEVLQVKFFILQQDIDANGSIKGVAGIQKN